MGSQVRQFPEHSFVVRDQELGQVEQWMVQRAASAVFSVQGIGGVGKTTFLSQVEALARKHGVRSIRLDGDADGMRGVDATDVLLQRMGAPVGDNVAGRRQVLRHHLRMRKTMVLLDHVESSAWQDDVLQTLLVPNFLVETDLAIVIATRRGLPLRWRIDPALMTRLQILVLDNFTPAQAMEYVRRAGITDVALGRRFARQTAGYPLALAMAVQSALLGYDQSTDGAHAVMEIYSTLIREVSAPLHGLVEGLAFVRFGTQDALAAVLGQEVTAEQYHALGQLSFVRRTDKGLVIHDVARAVLLHDLKVRSPMRFAELFRRTVGVIEAQLMEAPSYDLTHNLVTLSAHATLALHYPDASLSAQVSPKGLPQSEAFVAKDLGHLHRLIDDGVVATAACLGDPHALLETVARHFADSIRVLRREDGVPTGFATFVPLNRQALTALPAAAGTLARGIPDRELQAYAAMSGPSSDTCLSLLSGVARDDDEYTFFDLLLALKVTGWTLIAEGKRCLLLTSDPLVARYYQQLHYQPLCTRSHHGASCDVFALDFRAVPMARWMSSLLLQEAAAVTAVRPDVDGGMVRAALKAVRSPRALEVSDLAEALAVSGAELQRILYDALAASPPPAPLTRPGQQLLSLVYLEPAATAATVARTLYLSRTTYYRYLNASLEQLARALACRASGP
jgi:hypothetical protein